MEGDARQIASAADDSANSRSLFVLWRFSSEMVGATGFEPATPCAQGRDSLVFHVKNLCVVTAGNQDLHFRSAVSPARAGASGRRECTPVASTSTSADVSASSWERD